MPSLRTLIFLLPSIGLGVGCQKNSSSDPEPPPAPAPVTLGEGTPAPVTPAPVTPAPEPTPVTPEPTQPTTPGSPDNPAEPTPATPAVNPETPIEPGATPPESPVVVTPEPPVPEPVLPPTEFRIKESQFWVHTKIEGALTFNTPWDDAEGDSIIRDETLVPAYARTCLEAARSTYESIAIHKDFQAKLKPLLEKGVTPELTFLVAVVDSEEDRTALRRLDRDAYFWHWNDPVKKPVLTMNQYQKGSWVWEVIATPKTCIQPVIRDIGRMFDWTSRRLMEKEANL